LSLTAAIPGDRLGSQWGGGHGFLGLGTPCPFDRRSSFAVVGWWLLEQVSLRLKLADQAEPNPMAVDEPGQLVRPEAAITDEDEPPLGEP